MHFITSTAPKHAPLPPAARAALTSVTMARPSITGFDPKKLAAASANGTKGDPWARYEQWRYTGPFTRFQRFKGSFPGLGIATVAFGVYLAAEQAGLLGSEGGHHGDGGHHDETT
ncbi:hypothetical protein HBI04_117720 [Parastagonospora nodorum]|nr:hypothetical protein HBI03_002390 [Parastagonospora nodorum]KAH4276090.1 hypothetical protein HBI04_117720 [Parastagonospora nodorum]KAH4812842.1 hypothetical protein HBH61_081250 [Parastagonospora nodorum]KAH5403663.1 hypothetical protein HBI32_165220 [Parastagonospora nodorum]